MLCSMGCKMQELQDLVFVSCIGLSMELDLQSLLIGLHVHSCTHWLRPQNPPPCIWAHIRGRYWSAKIDDVSLGPLTVSCIEHQKLSRYSELPVNCFFL
jgi:hypothetical protein